MSLALPDEWKSHIDDIRARPGVTVVVGNVDTGKTTFCAILANQAHAAGISTAVVDGDLGQSEIGPPVTAGLGFVDAEIETIGNLRAQSTYFVGSTTPVGHLLSLCTGLKLLAEKAVARECPLIIVDTPGMVRGAIARKLHTHEIELLGAKHIVALQRNGEAEHFLRFFDTWEDCTVHRLPVAPAVRTKTPTVRKQRREVRFREYFLYSQAHELSLDAIATTGTWLDTGMPLEPKYLRFAEKALGVPVLHGETVDRGVYLVTKSEYNRRGIEELQEQFRTRNVVVIPAGRYSYLVVGLLGKHLELLSLGIIRAIDFRARTLSLVTPLRSIAPVKAVSFGVLKLRPEGTEIGRIRPGEL